MSTSELIEKIRPLPTDDKRQLIDQIWEEFGDELGCVDPDVTPEQIAEFERRAEELRKNPGAGIPWEQVRDSVRKRFGWE